MGTTFSALNLQITQTGGNELIRTLGSVDAEGQKIRDRIKAALDASNNDLTKIGQVLQKDSVAARETAAAVASIAPAAQQSRVAVQGMDASVQTMNTRAARATQGIARGFEMVARTGNLTGRSLDAVLSNVSQLALGFGETGILVGAIGIATAAIIEMFNRTKREMEESRKKFEEEVAKMANAGQAVQIEKQQRDLLYGLPYDDKNKLRAPSKYAKGTFEGSLADLEAHFADLQTRVPRGATMGPAKIADEWNTVVRALDAARVKFDQLRTAALNVANQSSTMTGLLPMITSAVKEKALTDAERQKNGDAVFGLLSHETLQGLGVQTSQYYGQADTKIDHKGLVTASKIVPTPDESDAKKTIEQWQKYAEQVGRGVADTLGNAIGSGLEALFQKGGNLKDGFKALTGSLLSGLGEMFEQAGKQALLGLQFIQTIVNAIATMNPAVGIAAAIGLIALGAALKGAGGRVSSASPGGGSGGGSHYAAAPLGGTIVVNPQGASSSSSIAGMQARPQVNLYATIFGKHDSGAQRELLDMIDLAQRRKT